MPPPASAACLVALAVVVASGASTQEADPSFHTSPECWSEPRLYHAGPPSGPLANRLHLIETPPSEPPGEAIASPNGAYRLWVRNPDTTQAGPWGAGLVIDHERPRYLALLIEEVAGPIAPRWINEKLVYVRIPWGRITFSDVILDVERGETIFHEVARDGTIAFQQFQDGCDGQCPCPSAGEAEGAHSGPTTPPTGAAGERGIRGLLLLPTVLGPPETGGVVPAEDPVPVPVYDRPDPDAEPFAELVDVDDFELREYTYEGAAAVVYESRPGWYRIGLRAALPGGADTAWVTARDTGDYLPVEKLIADRLTYLNERWDGYVWTEPGGGRRAGPSPLMAGREPGARAEYAVRILETRRVGDGLWLRVETVRDTCTPSTSRAVDRGWIPAYDREGHLVAWFYSRGC